MLLIRNLLTFVFVSLTCLLYAQTNAVKSESTKDTKPEGKGWFVEISGGYGLPFLTTNRKSPLVEIGDKDLYQRGQREISSKVIFGTNGNGWMGNVTVGHMFNKVLGIDATISAARHPSVLDARIDVPGYFASQYTGSDALYLAPHLIMRWRGQKKFGVTGRMGVLLPFYGKTASSIIIRDKQGRLVESLFGLPLIPIPGNIVDLTLKAKTLTKYNPTVGLSASISFDYLVAKNWTIFGQARVGAYTVSLKETNFQEASMVTLLLGQEVDQIGGLKTSFANVDEAPEFLKKIIYRKELTPESNTGRYGGQVDFNKPNDEIGQRFNASSIYLNIGVAYQFNRKGK